MILFFLGLSFAVGSCDTFLNDEDLEIAHANDMPERQNFTRIIEESLDVLKVHCVLFCGPFVLVECVLCCVYYTAITENCQNPTKTQ